ncbi:hypothetical protein [Corynebacterium anserum]|uniref:Uncharacterized protein n=1 Tax=Corynebacterium anserum TaxID=2684406 RepID=A0A7G7YQ39_9CORY|nr:hypothetical protein [Corynebacterium anserum]QNH96609.1 hypothetical protein GP473_07975 [Corynebacterium anserum]
MAIVAAILAVIALGYLVIYLISGGNGNNSDGHGASTAAVDSTEHSATQQRDAREGVGSKEAAPQPTVGGKGSRGSDSSVAISGNGAGSQGDVSRVYRVGERITATGTIRLLGAWDLARLQGYEQTPSGERNDEIYAVFIPDYSMKVQAKSSGGNGVSTREAKLFGLGQPHGIDSIPPTSAFSQYDGQKVTVTLTPQEYWPSDPRLPVGELYGENVSVN